MPSYAVAHMRQVTMGPAVVEYLQRIDATLAPFGGRFIVHGGEVEVLEGSWPGHLIVIEFPDRGQARAWYNSGASPAPARSAGSAVLLYGARQVRRPCCPALRRPSGPSALLSCSTAPVRSAGPAVLTG